MKRFAKIILVMTLLTVCLFCMTVPAQAQTIAGNGSVSNGIGKQTTLVDFSNGDLCGFSAIGNTDAPAFGYSESWKATVLKAPLDAKADKTGIRGNLASTSMLAGATSLSVELLAQYTGVESYCATLILESVDKNGAPILWQGDAVATAGHWLTVSFEISSFLSVADPEAPCSVTVLTSANVSENKHFTLFVKSLYINTPEVFPDFVLPVAAAACGFVFGFTFFFVIYRATCKRNRRPRWEER